MCGVVGLVGQKPVSFDLYDAISMLQHRGQDAAGIVTCEGDRLTLRKENGLVRDVFNQSHLESLAGNMGLAHVRYPTAGTSSAAEAQPMYVNSPFGICMAHNGNLINANELNEELFRTDRRHINTGSDSEVLLNVFAHELQGIAGLRVLPDDVFKAVERVHHRAVGAYAVVSLITGYGLVGFRDPNGIRPLVLGRRKAPSGYDYMLASESVALSVLGFELMEDIAPGEVVYIESNGQLHRRLTEVKTRWSPCIFEHVYLARPDSIMDGISVYKTRLKMGEKLADKILRLWPDHDIDVVIPIPDTSCTAALPMAHRLGVKYREGLVKNRYIGRTFIMPGQAVRKKSVRQKLNAIESEFQGRNVLLVDDSIVRGTTCTQIVQMAREAGANKVYFASAAPPVRYPNVYGIDMPSPQELIAHGRTEEEVAELIGADWLIFQDLEDLIAASSEGNPDIQEFECSVFTGEYVTGDIDAEYLGEIDQQRKDAVRSASGNLGDESATVGLYNSSADANG